MHRSSFIFAVFAVVLSGFAVPAQAFDATVLDAVVRLKPDWSLQARGVGAQGAPRDPEGTGVAVLTGGYIATNAHVIGDAKNVEVMLADGRVFASNIIGRDPLTDIALLKIEGDVPVLPLAPSPQLADPVCAIGNQFGLGLSVTCGVVSALARSGVGFNQIEDFIQTDASVNPGGSGGGIGGCGSTFGRPCLGNLHQEQRCGYWREFCDLGGIADARGHRPAGFRDGPSGPGRFGSCRCAARTSGRHRWSHGCPY